MRFAVRAQRAGRFVDVGVIETKPAYGPQFTYAESWLEAEPPCPLSLSLPLRGQAYPEKALRPYFEGLLPEEDARSAVARELGLPSTGYLRLLGALGRECIGAVMVLAEDDEGPGGETPGYVPLSDEELEHLAAAEYARASELACASRLSLAGAQAKTGLCHDPASGAWLRPVGTAPSNCIVKPASSRFPSLVENELFCMSLARACGIAAASCRLAPTRTPMLVVERYDRVPAEAPCTDGHAGFLRLHQEDFCQALGMFTHSKYEEGGAGYLAAMAQLLRRHSTQAAQDVVRLFELVVFDYLIGNCDAHVKNFSLLRDASWRELRLAPAYDLASTSIYVELSQTLGMGIGGQRRLGLVCREDFMQLAKDMYLGARAARACIERMREAVAAFAPATAGSDVAEQIAADALQRVSRLA